MIFMLPFAKTTKLWVERRIFQKPSKLCKFAAQSGPLRITCWFLRKGRSLAELYGNLNRLDGERWGKVLRKRWGRGKISLTMYEGVSVMRHKSYSVTSSMFLARKLLSKSPIKTFQCFRHFKSVFRVPSFALFYLHESQNLRYEVRLILKVMHFRIDAFYD